MDQIGAGVLGPVFRAQDTRADRLVAVKVFRLGIEADQSRRLADELTRLTALRLEHPAIPSLIAAGIEAGVPYLAQEYIAADSLDVALRQYGPPPLGDVLRLATELAGALDLAGVVGAGHGMLHPRDILVGPDDTRVTGLGVARALTRAGVRVPVRPPYTPPERIRGEDWTRTSDVFALAAIVYEMMSGRRIGGSGGQTPIGEGAWTRVGVASVRAVFARALAADPQSRYPTTLAFAAALTAAAGDLPAGVESRLDETPDEGSRVQPGPPVPARTSVVTDDPSIGRQHSLLDQTGGLAGQSVTASQTAGEQEPTAPQVHVVPDVPLRHEQTAQAAEPSTLPLNNEPDNPTRIDLDDHDHESASDLTSAAIRFAPPAFAGVSLSDFAPTREQEPLAEAPLTPALLGSQGGSAGPAGWSRAALIAVTLGAGLLIGALGGYLVASRGARPAEQVARPTMARHPVSAAAQPPSPSPGGREWTESALQDRPATLPAPPMETPASAAASTPGVQAAPAARGRLLIRSTPMGAQVTVDGSPRGVTPLPIRDLAFGSHSVRVARPGSEPLQKLVTISESRPAASLDFVFSTPRAAASGRSFFGSLSVDSRPGGASVFLNGRPAGKTPLVVPQLGAGSLVLRLEHDGYQRWSSAIRIVAGERSRVTASLERTGTR